MENGSEDKVITLEIDGREVEAEEGMTILEAARREGIEIPSICSMEGIEIYGACRLCCVEIERKGRTRIVASCGYPVEEGLKVETENPKIRKLRKNILELMAVTAGKDIPGEFHSLVRRFDADLDRFSKRVEAEPTGCVLCGLCVRVCQDIMWESPIGFVGRGTEKRVALHPELMDIRVNCPKYCADVCPTGKIQSIGPEATIPTVNQILSGRK